MRRHHPYHSQSTPFRSKPMSSFFGFAAAPVDVEIRLRGEEERKQVELKGERDRRELCPVYYDGESVDGQVRSRVAFCLMHV